MGKTFLRYCSGSKIGVGGRIWGEKITDGLSINRGDWEICSCSAETYKV
jgi:hypothetical protein